MLKTLRDMIVGAVITFAAIASVSYAALLLPDVQGPSLGTPAANPYSFALAINQMNQAAATAGLVANNAATRTTCTQIATPIVEFATVASTGAICLPAAIPGAFVFLSNTGSNTPNVYSSNAPAVTGTADTINGTAGSTAYQIPTTNTSMMCFSFKLGAWRCTGSI